MPLPLFFWPKYSFFHPILGLSLTNLPRSWGKFWPPPSSPRSVQRVLEFSQGRAGRVKCLLLPRSLFRSSPLWLAPREVGLKYRVLLFFSPGFFFLPFCCIAFFCFFPAFSRDTMSSMGQPMVHFEAQRMSRILFFSFTWVVDQLFRPLSFDSLPHLLLFSFVRTPSGCEAFSPHTSFSILTTRPTLLIRRNGVFASFPRARFFLRPSFPSVGAKRNHALPAFPLLVPVLGFFVSLSFSPLSFFLSFVLLP